jgi:hypothetical protein
MKDNMEKYINFDGMPSDVPNDMPWSNTRWSNFSNEKNDTITLSHHDANIGPDSVLTLPDSDFSNHPGFLGITWSAKNREKERLADEQRKVNANYPNSGSCGVLTDSLNRLNDSLDGLYAEGDSGKRSARRVRSRQITARETRLGSVQSSQAAACQEASMNQQNQAQLAALIQNQQKSATGVNPTMLLIGGVVIAGVIFAVSRMGRGRDK